MVKTLRSLSTFTLILSLLTSYTLADEVKSAPHALVKATPKPAKKPAKKPIKPARTPLFDSEKESFIAEGDFLYWNLTGQGQVNYALQTESVSDTFSRQSYADTTSFYNPGMRFKLGYYRATNFWDLTADYTLIHFESRGKQQASSHRSLVSLFTDNSNTLLSTRCDTLTSYKNFNIMASRVFLPGATPYLRLRLEGGAGFSWMRQTSRINNAYEAGISESIINHWRYWGGGVRGALSFDWYLGENIYMTGLFFTRTSLWQTTPR